jgi:hypothetical protein
VSRLVIIASPLDPLVTGVTVPRPQFSISACARVRCRLMQRQFIYILD